MSVVLIKAGMFFVFLAVILTAVGMATSSWITACIPFNAFIAMMRKLHYGTKQDDWLYFSLIFRGRSICFRYGLYQITLSVLFTDSNLFIPFKALDLQMQFIISCISVGQMLTALSALIIVYFLFGQVSTSEKKKSLIITSCIALQLVGCVISGVGIASYTYRQSAAVHNPAHFTEELVGLVESWRVHATPLGESYADKEKSYVVKNEQDYFKSAITGENEDKKAVLSVFQNLDPIFGYSFYLVWLGFGFSFLSWVAFLFGYRSMMNWDTSRFNKKTKTISF